MAETPNLLEYLHHISLWLLLFRNINFYHSLFSYFEYFISGDSFSPSKLDYAVLERILQSSHVYQNFIMIKNALLRFIRYLLDELKAWGGYSLIWAI